MNEDAANETVLTDGEEPTGYKTREGDAEWLQLAEAAYKDSTDWMDTNRRRQMEKNYALFQSRHPPGSKYYSPQYQHRARGFRPKIRSAIRNNEAAAHSAFFSTSDVAYVEAQNKKDPKQVASAALNKELLNYRLKKTIPWVQICLGGFQEAQVNGATIAAIEWQYTERTEEVEVEGVDENGEPIVQKAQMLDIINDKPSIRLVPLENFRFDPAADWADPINSSPYIIELMPMYVIDVIARMNDGGSKTGAKPWRQITIAEMKSAESYDYDTTRAAREGNRQDPKSDRSNSLHLYSTVWVRRVIMRKSDGDYLFYMLGSQYMLADPVPLEDEILHGMRPYVMGICILEAFRTYPSGTVELGQELQTSANELANTRRDNVNLALNKRYHIQRGKNVDLAALMRNVPGGGVLMDDLEAVEVIHTPDVTGSSYQEQDRLNVDFDELMGQFSQSSVQSNRSMNETVGGLELVSAGANQMTEYLINIFAITFVQKVLYQLVALEQAYETDEVLLALAAEQAQLYQKFGVDAITDDLLRQKLTVTINVGIDATDPVRRIQKMLYAMGAIQQALALPGINRVEVIKEILGAIGYTDASRFFMDLDNEEDPRIAQFEQTIAELQKVIETDQAKIQAQGKVTLEVEKVKAEAAAAVEKRRHDAELDRLEIQHIGDMKKLTEQFQAQLELARENNDSTLEREQEKHENALDALEKTFANELKKLNEEHENKMDEIELKAELDREEAAKDRKFEKDKIIYMENRRTQEVKEKPAIEGETA